MATTLPPIGQAVVTDPGTTGASGYTLVAWSPSVSNEEQAHFARVPQVSDYLHLESVTRVYFSFYGLSEGRWAFGKRFARGTRRGSYNRIVAYTLVLPEEVMDILEWEPRLLPACSFESAGQEWSFQDLTAWPGDIPRALPDLRIIPPADCTERRHTLLESRRRFLEGHWERDGLEDVLAQALGVLESGSGLLLPQGDDYEQLLGLVDSALPRRDRRAISWTTHLAPGGLELFRLANVPSPEEARAHAGPSWSLLRDAPRRSGSLAVATALTAGGPSWARVASEWYEATDASGLSLMRDGAQVKRWTTWVEKGGPPPEGCKSIPDLEAYFSGHAIDRSSLTDPWEGPVSRLALVARTTANLERAGRGAEAGKSVYGMLVVRGLAAALLTPQYFEELLGLPIDAGTQEAALGLCLRQALPADKVRLLGAALGAARGPGKEVLAGRIAAKHVIPAVAAAPDLAPLLGDRLDFALAALQAVPQGLAEALRTWRDTLYDRAIKELRLWLRDAPKAALEVAGFCEEEAAQERSSVIGLAELLASHEVPAERWLPFALAEAAALDRTGEAAGGLRSSSKVDFSAGKVGQAAATRLFQQLARKDLNPGAAHRTLVARLAAELATRPEQAVAVFSSFSRLPDTELRAWGGPIAVLAKAVQGRGRRAEASALGSNWLKQVAMISWGGLPNEVVDLLDVLTDADRSAVASVWAPKLPRITPSPEEKASFIRFRDRLLTDPNLRRRYELSEVGVGMRSGRMAFTEGAEKILALLSHQERGDDLLQALAESLPQRADERLKVLFALVLSPRLMPSARRLVQERLFWAELGQVGRDLFWVLPPVEDLSRRGVLLLRVLQRAGELWLEDPDSCCDRLKEVLKLGRLDAVAAFLHGTVSVRPSFLEVLASKDGDSHLLAGLRKAAREPLAAWRLGPFLPLIIGSSPSLEDLPR